jgi:hypothetical protein
VQATCFRARQAASARHRRTRPDSPTGRALGQTCARYGHFTQCVEDDATAIRGGQHPASRCHLRPGRTWSENLAVSRSAVDRFLNALSASAGSGPPVEPLLEAAFVRAAAHYGRKKGISYLAWLAVGIDPELLHRAGIRPSGST